MNKLFYVFLGALVGYFIAKNRMDKNLLAKTEKAANDATDAIAKAVDGALAHAEANNIPVSEVRSVLNGSATVTEQK